MPLRESEAIVLRTTKLGEADKIVSLLTRQWGRLRAVAAGARRPKSRWGSQLEPMTHIRAWIFERENRDLLRMNSADLIESFFGMQKDYDVQVAAQYLVEVTEHMLPERDANERAFRLLVAVLKGLKNWKEVNRPLVYFDYWMLKLGGVLPDFERCQNCGQALANHGEGTEPMRCPGGRLSFYLGPPAPFTPAVAWDWLRWRFGYLYGEEPGGEGGGPGA